MKCIFIMSDSYRRDHVGAYGNNWIHTPNLDALAGTSNVFDRAYTASFPTGPNRRDIHVGHGAEEGHIFNPWVDIADEETTMTQRLDERGVHSMMITDVSNGVTYGHNMFKGFNFYTINRGQEGDGPFSDASVPLRYEVPPGLTRYRPEIYHRIQMARAHRRVEEDYFAPGTFKLACEWLERNWKRDNFFLWVETFDPHEPWDPPPWHVERYDPGYTGRVFECPPYGYYRKMGITKREMRHVQARYAGECTMVDAGVGRLLATLERLQLMDEVAIIFTSDHGLYAGHQGDAGCVCKPWLVSSEGYFMAEGKHPGDDVTYLPMRTGTMRIPLMIKLPGQRRTKRVRHIAQPWDMQPTVLDLFGHAPIDKLVGESLLPVLRGEGGRSPQYAFNAVLWTGHYQAMNEHWLYAYWLDGKTSPWLIDLKNDADQKRNVARQHPEVCRRMHAAVARRNPKVFKSVPE